MDVDRGKSMFRGSIFKLVRLRQRLTRVRRGVKCCAAQEQGRSLKSGCPWYGVARVCAFCRYSAEFFRLRNRPVTSVVPRPLADHMTGLLSVLSRDICIVTCICEFSNRDPPTVDVYSVVKIEENGFGRTISF